MDALNKYRKLLLFIISVIVVYFLFSDVFYEPLHGALAFLGYFGTLLAGLLYPYSFTTAAGTAILLIIAKEQNLLLAGILAAVGALISDLIIFFFVKYGFSDEVKRLSKEGFVQRLCTLIPNSIRTYLLAAFASILIAAPLPTEIGILLMTSIRKLSTKKFVIIVYVLHVCAIFVILLLGKI